MEILEKIYNAPHRIKKTKASASILNGYKEADKGFWVNDNDPDLEPIWVKLPKPPPIHMIDGYGLPAEEQRFQPALYPPRLKQLEEKAIDRLQAEYIADSRKIVTGQKILEEIYTLLNREKHLYLDEIRWIEDQIYYVQNGYWFFCDGKPSFITGWHYMYINFWNLDIGIPDYRDRDRRWFNFAYMCYTTRENEKGEDLGFRTCYGFTYPKHRRDGATFKCLCIGYCINLWKKNSRFGIQSFDDDNASEHFQEKLIPAWQKLPFFFRPMWDGTNNPADGLRFKLPRNKVLGRSNNSLIDFATTAHRKAYDGKKQMAHLSDENGKTEREDVFARHVVVKQTLSQGNGAVIHGFSMHPTTVADMEKGGGMQFFHMCNRSKFYERNKKTGQTITGLFRLFIPAYDGLEGFIGPYGESIIEDPTPLQAAYINRNYGAKEHLQSEIDQLTEAGDAESLRKLKEQIQLFPMTYADCFRMTGGDVGFDTQILDTRIAEMRRLPINSELRPIQGDFFYRINGIDVSADDYIRGELFKSYPSPDVVFRPDANGKFYVSKLLPQSLANLKYSKIVKDDLLNNKTVYFPENKNNITASSDPYTFLDPTQMKLKENKDTMSDGGGAAFWKRDKDLDPDHKPLQEWESCRFVCTYRDRPALDIVYAEKMLMMCLYYGCFIYPERNIKLILNHFYNRNHQGFLEYKVDIIKGKQAAEAGFVALSESKDDLFKATRNHIRLHGLRERHLDLLMEWRSIANIKLMTDFDLLTAAGGCLLSAENKFQDFMESTNTNRQAYINLHDITQTFRY